MAQRHPLLIKSVDAWEGFWFASEMGEHEQEVGGDRHQRLAEGDDVRKEAGHSEVAEQGGIHPGRRARAENELME